MKASLFLTFLIMAGAGLLGWRGHARMEAAQERQRELEIKSAGLDHPMTRPPTRRPELAPKALAAELLAFKEGEDPDLEKAGRELALLDDKGMQAFVSQILSSSMMDDEKRGRMVLILMKMALSDRPRASLSLFDTFSSAGGKPDPEVAAKLVPHALEKLMGEDPADALEWLGIHGGNYPEIISEGFRLRVLTAAAACDPQRAFREIANVGIAEPQDAVCAIMRAGNSPAQRLAVIAALRGHLALMSDERLKKERSQAAITQLAQSAAFGGDSVAREWVAAARFTPAEMDTFAAEIASKAVMPREIGGWVECLASAGAETFPGQPVHKMVEYWTQQDYRAAGEWLASSRDGPAKQAAVQAYAATVAKYDPATAEQWTLTLPAGKDRDATLAKIHGQWPEDDSSGKMAFAARHGIR